MNHPNEIRIQYHDEVAHGARIKVIGVGGGGGKVLHVGDVPVNVSVGAYWNVLRPDTIAAPSGSVQVQVAVLFSR